jgi:hypothetical protein
MEGLLRRGLNEGAAETARSGRSDCEHPLQSLINLWSCQLPVVSC